MQGWAVKLDCERRQGWCSEARQIDETMTHI